jgi:hypothetical protein
MTSTASLLSAGEILKQDSLGRVRTPFCKRQEILAVFDGSGMSAARFAAMVGLNYSTFKGGMNRGDRLQSDRGHGLHIDWGVCPGKMSYQWNRNNDLLIWRKAVGLR